MSVMRGNPENIYSGRVFRILTLSRPRSQNHSQDSGKPAAWPPYWHGYLGCELQHTTHARVAHVGGSSLNLEPAALGGFFFFETHNAAEAEYNR